MIGARDHSRSRRARSTPSPSGSPRSSRKTSGLWLVASCSASRTSRPRPGGTRATRGPRAGSGGPAARPRRRARAAPGSVTARRSRRLERRRADASAATGSRRRKTAPPPGRRDAVERAAVRLRDRARRRRGRARRRGRRGGRRAGTARRFAPRRPAAIPGPRSATSTVTPGPTRARADLERRARRRVLGGVLEQVHEQLLEQDRVDRDEREPVGSICGRDRPAGERALEPRERDRRSPPRPGPTRASARPRPSRAASCRAGSRPCRSSRSASSQIASTSSRRGRGVERRLVAQRRRRAGDRGERRPEVVRHGGEQPAAQPLGVGAERGASRLLGEPDAIERERGLPRDAPRRGARCSPASGARAGGADHEDARRRRPTPAPAMHRTGDVPCTSAPSPAGRPCSSAHRAASRSAAPSAAPAGRRRA